MKSPVVKRSIVLRGHKTSVSLEDEFWKGLKEIAGKRLMTLSVLVDGIDANRQQGNLFVGSPPLRLGFLSEPNPRGRRARGASRDAGAAQAFAFLGAVHGSF